MLEKKIKVAHIITRLIIGGAQENTLYTVDSLQRDKRFEVTLVSGETLGPEGKLYETGEFKLERLYVCPYLTREISLLIDIKAVIDLYKYFKKEKFDIVHTHSSKAGIVGRVAAYLAGVPYIYHTIHGLPFHDYEKWYKNLIYIYSEKFCSYMTRKIITVCDTMGEKALKAGISRKSKYITVYSGMDIERYTPKFKENERNSLREKLGIKDSDFIFVKIARLFELKGHEYIIEIAKDIIKEHPYVKFMFVGDGLLKEFLEKKVKDVGLKSNFIFTGLVSPYEVPKYIEISDAVVHTSLREGLARVIPQGFLMGKPVISFDIDGAKELIKNNKTGYLVPAEDVDELKKAMIHCIDNKELAIKMANAGQRLCRKLYSAEKMGQDIIDIYLKNWNR